MMREAVAGHGLDHRAIAIDEEMRRQPAILDGAHGIPRRSASRIVHDQEAGRDGAPDMR
nr:hypothetical protein [Roseomonas oleicola]